MADISWHLVLSLASTGIGMGLVSCFVGMRPKLENPLWWLLYFIWITVVLSLGSNAPFLTLLLASVLAGLLHGCTSALLIDKYIQNNPWHSKQMQGPKSKLARRFVAIGLSVGVVFGVVVGGIGWSLSRLLLA
ncbi:MAG: hypothetical protein E2O78_02765 [Caldithrix sp.]|nr:MAG: hypothetical protein E2O78_02765 [Caldithrix sp.]